MMLLTLSRMESNVEGSSIARVIDPDEEFLSE